MYNINDIDDFFYQQTIQEIKKEYVNTIEFAQLFNNQLNKKITSVERYCPIREEHVKYPFPFAEYIKKLHYFIKGKYDTLYDVKIIIDKIEKTIFRSWIGKKYVQKETRGNLMDTRIGFMLIIAKKRISLLEGNNLTARDLALLTGITGQGIVNKITRGIIEGKKIGNTWSIDNKEAIIFIKEREHPFYKGIITVE